ncbi:MAG: preprotein translocase subunit SecG [Victivallaceae bacterium]|nr:preprotein translocase subunit SecG [Victivallaceae bacterium]
MDILINIMYTAVVIVSLLLICLVLVQPSKSGGMGAAFGGLGQSVFGAQAGSHLTKLTVIMTSIFFVLALLLAFLIGHRAGLNTDAGLEKTLETTAADMGMTAPAQPSQTAAEAAITEVVKDIPGSGATGEAEKSALPDKTPGE